METRMTLYAAEGYVLTDGVHYGRVVTLAVGADPSAWREITEEEYAAIMAAEGEEKNV